MSFITNLRKVKEAEDAFRAKQKQKVDAFNSVNFEQQDTSIVDFDGEAIESDPFAPEIRLVKRYTPHEQLVQMVPSHCDKLTVTQFLKQVAPPIFERPTTSEANFLVFGIIASKSPVKESSRGVKYIMFTLSDLKYDISLSVHGKACDILYKLQPGTLIAVLNPSIYLQKLNGVSPNPAFSINMAELVVEIGQAKDLGHCESLNITKKRCSNWVDVRKTKVCDLHATQSVRTKRPELNSSSSSSFNPRSRGRRMAVIKGGEVKWKRGLQIDTQDHLIGSKGVYQGGGQAPSSFFNAFEEASAKRKMLVNQKRNFQRTAQDNRLGAQLDAAAKRRKQSTDPAEDRESRSKPSSGKKSTSESKSKSKPKEAISVPKEAAIDPKKYGFDAKLLRRIGYAPPREKNAASRQELHKRLNLNAAADSDSDLEIV